MEFLRLIDDLFFIIRVKILKQHITGAGREGRLINLFKTSAYQKMNDDLGEDDIRALEELKLKGLITELNM